MSAKAAFRRAVSKLRAASWLRRASWLTRPMPRTSRFRDAASIRTLYRIHYDSDPFLSSFSPDWALATPCQCDVQHYASVQRPSDCLPAGYSFLTEFSVPPETRYTGDFKHERLLDNPADPYQRDLLSEIEALHVAGLHRLASVQGCESAGLELTHQEARAWLYEARVIRGVHMPVRTTIVRRCGDQTGFLFETEIQEYLPLRTKRSREMLDTTDPGLRFRAGRHDWTVTEEQPVHQIETLGEYDSVVRSRKLQMPPLDAAVITALIAFRRRTDYVQWVDLVRKQGWESARVHLVDRRLSPERLHPIAFELLPLISHELERSFIRLERGFGVKRLEPAHYIADLLDQMIPIAGPLENGSVYRSCLAFRARESCNDIFSGALAQRGIDVSSWRQPPQCRR
jgi:hypothetical protein